MFHIEPHRFFSRIFGAWFLFTMLAVFSAGIQPRTLILPAVIVVLGLSLSNRAVQQIRQSTIVHQSCRCTWLCIRHGVGDLLQAIEA
jgi:hypothetical protein